MSKVGSQEHKAFGIQPLVLKVESQKHRAIKFFSLFDVIEVILNLFCICLSNLSCKCLVFQVSSEDKVDLDLANILFNLLIMQVFEPLSFIPPWNKRVDNFIKSTMFFADMFLFNRGVVIIMHANDPQVFKEIHSFLENYQLKVCMKWIVINLSPQMSSEDPSSQVPQISLSSNIFLLCIH
jgi:hypothetical protein